MTSQGPHISAGAPALERFGCLSHHRPLGGTGEVAASVARSRRRGARASGRHAGEAEVDAAPDARVLDLRDGGREAREAALDARQASGRGGESRAITVEGGEHRGGCVAHARMPRRVLLERWCRDQRRPGGIRAPPRSTTGSRNHRPPLSTRRTQGRRRRGPHLRASASWLRRHPPATSSAGERLQPTGWK